MQALGVDVTPLIWHMGNHSLAGLSPSPSEQRLASALYCAPLP